MLSASRFETPSASLRLRFLLEQTRSGLWIGLGLAVAVHVGSAQVRVLTQTRKASKPLTTQFVKRQPRLTKPLELKKRPRPRRRTLRRTMVSVEARGGRGRTTAAFVPTRVMKGLARPRVDVSRATSRQRDVVEPQAIAQAVEGTKQAKDVVDLSLEMLDIEALNVGKYHALVTQDPADKRNIRGFCRLAVAYSRRIYPDRYPRFETYIMPAFLHLSQAMNQYTDVTTTVIGKVTLDDAELLKAPWLYFMAFFGFELRDIELRALGTYLSSGGFVFADGHPYVIWEAGARSLRGALSDAFRAVGVSPSTDRLPNTHPVYHCYFDFDGPPSAADIGISSTGGRVAGILRYPYLEGMELEGRLVAIFGMKGYYAPWCYWGALGGLGSTAYDELDPTPQLKFGINTIIFALTQEGSITQRLLDSIHY